MSGGKSRITKADAVTAQVIRHGLDGVADFMKISMARAAFSPIIYDAHDFAAAIYDAELNLLAQSKTLPLFNGTLDVCIRSAIKAVGGIENFAPGDVVMSNYAYETAAHANDIAIVLPGFYDGELVGFSAIKGHMMDVGGKSMVPVDSTDVWQEGTIYPSVRLYRGGERNEDLYRTLLANSRMPRELDGDLSAAIGAARGGLTALNRVIERYGLEVFRDSTKLMFDAGEKRMIDALGDFPKGRFETQGAIDGDGINAEPIPYKVAIEVTDEKITFDLRDAPKQVGGPVNNPRDSMVSACRAATLSLAGNESANEGHFRVIEVLTEPGTIFHAEPPAPVGIYAFPLAHFTDTVFSALAKAKPDGVPAAGSEIAGIIAFGESEERGFWGGAVDICGGQGACGIYGDGGGPLMHMLASGTRITSWEVWESRFPIVVERSEYAVDSGGHGEYRGGLGFDHVLRAEEDMNFIVMLERTMSPVVGVKGGGEGRQQVCEIERPDGSVEQFYKSQFTAPKGSKITFKMCGGGGYGDAGKRDPEAVKRDLELELVSEDVARKAYPHAFQ